MTEDDRLITEAEGYAELGLFDHAWELYDSIAPARRTDPSVVRVKMICAFGMRRFEMAEELARHLRGGDEREVRMAGKILHELAAIHLLAGNIEPARRLVKDAVEIYPKQRIEILDDERLKDLL